MENDNDNGEEDMEVRRGTTRTRIMTRRTSTSTRRTGRRRIFISDICLIP